MIEVTINKKGAEPVRVQIPEGKDPFEVCMAVIKNMGITVMEEDREHDAVMLARHGPGEPAPRAGNGAAVRAGEASSSAVVKDDVNGGSIPLRPATKHDDMFLELPPAAPTVGVRAASVEAYRKIERSGKLTAQQEVVMAWVRSRIGDHTRQEISRGTELPINAVCGRVHELVDLGELRETRRRRCRVTGENVNALVAS